MPNLNNPMVPRELLIVGAALKGGIFDSLYERPARLEDLVSNLAMDSRAVWIVVEALISLGYIARDNEVLHLTPEAVQLLFDETSNSYIGYSLIHTFNVIKAWTNLPEILKTGQPPERVRDVQDARGFMAAMKKSAAQVSSQLVDSCLAGLPKNPSILDIGGGPLNYARPFSAAGAAVTVQDLPEICKLMGPTILPEENIKFSIGDFTETIAPGQFDLAFLGNICHIYGENENIQLFKRVNGALSDDGSIAILDFVRGASSMAELFAVNMLANTKTGGTWTLEQYIDWLEEAGYGQVEMHNINDQQLITARKTKNNPK